MAIGKPNGAAPCRLGRKTTPVGRNKGLFIDTAAADAAVLFLCVESSVECRSVNHGESAVSILTACRDMHVADLATALAQISTLCNFYTRRTYVPRRVHRSSCWNSVRATAVRDRVDVSPSLVRLLGRRA